MGRRLKFHITATISIESGEYLERIAEEFFNGNRSEALDAVIRWAKENGFHIVAVPINNKIE
jgi:hypothetical protein